MPRNFSLLTVLLIVVCCSALHGQRTRRRPTSTTPKPAVNATPTPTPTPAPTPTPTPPPDLQQLIDVLGVRETEKSLEAAEKIGSYGEAAAPAIPRLVEMLQSRGLETLRIGNQQIMAFDVSANVAANALSRIGKPARTPLRTLLTDGEQEPSRRQWAARALVRMKHPEALQIVLELLKQSTQAERANLLPALRDSESPQALEVLLGFVTDADAKVRKGAIEGLSGKKDQHAVDALVVALRDTDRDVRGAAAGGLITAADPRTFDPLVQALKDNYDRVRNLSSQALGAIKDRRAIEPLIDIVTNDKVELVRFQAGRALGKITGENFGEDGARWKTWWERQKKTQ